MTYKSSRGFTLIEAMITVAIISIIAAIAYPSYTSYVVRSSREAAKSELLHLSTAQEKIFLNSDSYAVSVTAAYNGRADGGLGRTTGKTTDGRYALSIIPTATPTQIYTITATPVAGSSQVGDGNITITSSGQRDWNSKSW
jgi:type IV pilus assembly protein PilE